MLLILLTMIRKFYNFHHWDECSEQVNNSPVQRENPGIRGIMLPSHEAKRLQKLWGDEHPNSSITSSTNRWMWRTTFFEWFFLLKMVALHIKLFALPKVISNDQRGLVDNDRSWVDYTVNDEQRDSLLKRSI